MQDNTIVKISRQPTRSTARDLHLVCVFSGDQVVECSSIPIKDELVLGRTILPSLGVVDADTTMSRHHFRIRRDNERTSIEDNGSSNGTFVNRRALSDTPEILPGDVIRAGETLFLVTENPPADPVRSDDHGFVTRNHGLRRILDRLGRVAKADISVLVLGETGTGKDVLAQHLHRLSAREGRFVPVNCSAIPATLLEASLFGHEKGAFTGADQASVGMFRTAERGTLFLDEIGEMGPDLQAKLLRSLETRSVIPVGATREIKVDVRIVAATSRSRSELEAGCLREDLLGRLEDLVIQLPPLRQRREDILFFSAREIGSDNGVPFGTADVAEALLCYSWPRNVRELIRSVRSALLLHDGAPALRWEDLKEGIRYAGGFTTPMPGSREIVRRAPPAVDDTADETQQVDQGPPGREVVEALYAECAGNVSMMARRLGRHRKQVYRWLERYGLKD